MLVRMVGTTLIYCVAQDFKTHLEEFDNTSPNLKYIRHLPRFSISNTVPLRNTLT